MLGTANVSKSFGLGGGAQFFAYISPNNDTPKLLKKWRIILQHTTSNWMGEINSDNPSEHLKTPDLSGMFMVKVLASGENFGEKELGPEEGSSSEIGCFNNCIGMIGIVVTEDGKSAEYWTVWNALCN
ncbi:MAG: hypothetical protein LBS19_13645 [Clostridiales bacterium]|jgi:hypothetical protein|nr:hypothetical protein [Clostridiales bacterium]